MEGKEQRLQASGSTLMAVAATTSGNGATNAALDSFTGLGGSIPMADIMTGEVIFGSVGSGLYGMLLMVVLAVFIAGLMVGRTPEYLGKKIEAREIKLVTIGVIVVPSIVLFMSAWAISTRYGLRSIFNAGPQGFSETLYAYTSQANNNGSAFAGYIGFVQPHPPGNRAPAGSPSPTSREGARCSWGASCRCCSRSRCGGIPVRQADGRLGRGDDAHRHGGVRRAAHRDDLDRRAPDVRARGDARTARAGADPEAVLMLGQLRSAVVTVLVLTVLLGLAYPLAITGVAQVLWSGQANGSRVKEHGRTVGSLLIGQDFAGDLRYFQSRPSASAYDPAQTSASNLGPNSEPLEHEIRARVAAFLGRERPYDPGLTVAAIPVDAVTASGSGVDPTSRCRWQTRASRRTAWPRSDTCRWSSWSA